MEQIAQSTVLDFLDDLHDLEKLTTSDYRAMLSKFWPDPNQESPQPQTGIDNAVRRKKSIGQMVPAVG